MSPPTITPVYAPDDDVKALVDELEEALAAHYPSEQQHGARLDELFQPDVRFFVAALDGVAVGCGGVAFFDDFAEVKRMYVRPATRGRGVAQAILARLESEARGAKLSVLRLETGDKQHDALRLYRRYGFTDRGAFGRYARMEHDAIAASVFLEKRID